MNLSNCDCLFLITGESNKMEIIRAVFLMIKN